MKKCPFCAKEIQNEAIKCRYCRERLDTKPTTTNDASVTSIRQSTVVTPPTKKKNEDPLKSYLMKWRSLLLAIVIAGVGLSIIAIFLFRYETDQVGHRMIRYDRLTSRVEWKSIYSKIDEWHVLRFNSLQQAKAVFHRQDLENAAETVRQKEASERQQNEMSNDIQKEMKRSDDDYRQRMREIDDEHNRRMREIDDDQRDNEAYQQRMRQIDTESKMRQQQSEIDNSTFAGAKSV